MSIDNKTLAFPQSGMNRDKHPSTLKEEEYTFAMNANIESEDGDVNMRSNEQGNIKCIGFGGFKVIGYKNDLSDNITYFFLTNPDTRVSKIVFIKSPDELDGLSDSFIEGAVSGREDICASADTLIEDSSEDPCLNFSINHPIKTIEIKVEKCGKCIYWTDGYNPPRYVIVEKALKWEEGERCWYHYHGYKICGDGKSWSEFMRENGCVLACEKLRIFPELDQPLITPAQIEYGGSLRAGVYQFAVALCDEFGNERASYSALTNPVHIFDRQNIRVEDGKWGARTNLGIRLVVSNIDRQAEYFKVAVVQNTVGYNGETQPVVDYFIEGIHPVTEKTILYYSDLNNKRTTFEHIAFKKPVYNTSEGMVSVGNRLLQYGLTAEKEWNLQPVVSLMGHFLEWQTSVGSEDLYKDGKACSLYVGYMRDEVYTFGISFKTNTGYKTPVFALVPPPETSSEPMGRIRESDKAYRSINKYAPGCSDTKREYMWQYFNYAKSQELPDIIRDKYASGGCKNEAFIGQTAIREADFRDFDGVYFSLKNVEREDIQLYISENMKDLACSSVNIDVGPNPELNKQKVTEICKLFNDYEEYNDNHQDAELSAIDKISYPEFPSGCKDIRRESSILTVPYDGIRDIAITPYYKNYKNMEETSTDLIFVMGGEDSEKYTTLFGPESIDDMRVYVDKYFRPGDGSDLNDDAMVKRQPEALLEGAANNCKILGITPCSCGCNIRNACLNPIIYSDGITQFQPDSLLMAGKIFPYNAWQGDQSSHTETMLGKYYYNYWLTDWAHKEFYKSSKEQEFIKKATFGDPDNGVVFDTKPSGGSYDTMWHKYRFDGVSSSSDMTRFNAPDRTNSVFSSGIGQWHFFNTIGKNARWIEVTRPDYWGKDYWDNTPIVLEMFGKITGLSDAASTPYVRISFWKDLNGTPLNLNINMFFDGVVQYKTSDGTDKYLYSDNSRVYQTSGHIIEPIYKSFMDKMGIDKFYISIDTPVIMTSWIMTFREDNYNNGDKYSRGILGYSYMLARTNNPYVVGVRDREVDQYDVQVGRFSVRASVTFAASCSSCGDSPLDCAPRPYKRGSFAYWESSERYPANYELFDSSKVLIRRDRYYGYNDRRNEALSSIKNKLRSLYEDNTRTIDGDAYIYYTDRYFPIPNVRTSTVLCQKPIRHYKFPDNQCAPFMGSDERSLGSKSEIYPMGILIDEDIVRVFLDSAVDSGLINQEQRDSIVGYELYRGDRRLNRSIVASGLSYNMFKYKDDSGNINLYSNYPYNDLSEDQYNYQDGRRKRFIEAPGGKYGNIWYTFHSPDSHFNKFDTPTEATVDGFQRGMSSGLFTSVDEHPKWTVLGPGAYRMAKTLANIEATATIASLIAEEMQVRAQSAYVGLVGNLSVAFLFSGMVMAVSQTLARRPMYFGKYRYDWLNAFMDNGPRLNYAWYYTSIGLYNSMVQFNPGNDYRNNYLRGLSVVKEMKSGIYPIVDGTTTDVGEGPGGSDLNNGNILYVNNIDRESSIFLSFGGSDSDGFAINYPEVIRNYDNSRVDDPCIESSDKTTQYSYGINKLVSYIASPYMKLKRYKPDQYGAIEDINWVSIANENLKGGYKFIFGGDTFISRFSLKRKFPFFYNNAFHMGDMIPFPYNDYRNVGYPRYFVNYDTGDDALEYVDNERFMSWTSAFSGMYSSFPNRKSTYFLNAYNGDRYARGRFYLWFYGIPQFLVESEVNCNFRLEGNSPDEWFYPAVGDYVWWTQEKNVSIQRDNVYKISPIYSSRMTLTPNVLPATYERKFYDCAYQRPNGVIWSRTDVSENSQTDPWLFYKAMDYHEFPTKYGKLIHLECIESEQILARFEDQVSLHNAIDAVRERTITTAELGTGGLFASRPLEYNTTDLGYSGTQSTEIVSCEFGHVWVDVKRAQVFMTDPNGRNLHELSTGIRHWLKKNLPFKILKYDIAVEDEDRSLEYKDVDNKFIGLGLSLGWDNRYKRVFITKKDYVPVESAYHYKFKDGKFKYDNREVSLTDKRYFKDVSFTIAYSCIKKEWISYYSFCPDYYVEQQSYFQTGLNYSKDNSELGLWSHLLSNKYYQTFYGKTYPFQLEVPIKENFKGNILSSVEYELDARKYYDNTNYTVNRLEGLDEVVVYNETNNSGTLRLIPEVKNDIYQKALYPVYKTDGVEILDTEVYGRHKINDFFNAVDDDLSGKPIWKKDDNDINKEIDNSALNFGKMWKDRLRGSWMLMRLKKTTKNVKVIFKWAIGESKDKNR